MGALSAHLNIELLDLRHLREEVAAFLLWGWDALGLVETVHQGFELDLPAPELIRKPQDLANTERAAEHCPLPVVLAGLDAFRDRHLALAGE